MKESATSAIATMPIAKVSGAAGPVACTTSVMLKAAVTVGEMTERESAMASGSLRRVIRLLCTGSPHHEGSDIGVRHHFVADVGQSLIDDGDAFLDLGLAQCQRRCEFQYIATQSDIKEYRAELVGAINHFRGRAHRHWLACGAIAHQFQPERKATAAHLPDHRLVCTECVQALG